MTEPNQNQLWRDLELDPDPMKSIDRKMFRCDPDGAVVPIWQRPVTCNCPSLREALETLMFGAPSACRRSKGELHQPGICGYCDGMKALAATPCTSGGKSEEKLWSDDWHKVIQEVLKCDPIPASKRVDGKLEPPSEVIARIRADRDQWKERAEGWKKVADSQAEQLEQQPSWIPLHGPGSRKPTAEDGDERGRIVVRWNEQGIALHDWRTAAVTSATHFHPLSKFTPPPDPDEGAFKKCKREVNDDMSPMTPSGEEIATRFWQAALAHRDAQQKARS